MAEGKELEVNRLKPTHVFIVSMVSYSTAQIGNPVFPDWTFENRIFLSLYATLILFKFFKTKELRRAIMPVAAHQPGPDLQHSSSHGMLGYLNKISEWA